jgi:hypothetical protein
MGHEDVIRQMREESRRSGFRGAESIKLNSQGQTIRAIWNRIHWTSETETYHEFIVSLLKQSLGRNWKVEQDRLPGDSQHVIMKWIAAWHTLAKANMPENHQKGEVFSASPTGETQELIALAHDIYRLQLVKKLPAKLMERLRTRNGFQGARYEIAVASAFARCGFEIEWLKNAATKHCEFIATHKTTKERVAVEAKSRHRKGVLHESGVVAASDLADIEGLYDDAMTHNPGNMPFAVFIDVNLPHEPDRQGLEKLWFQQVKEMMGTRPTPTTQDPDFCSLRGFTNFGWHYCGAQQAIAPHEFVLAWSFHAKYPVSQQIFFALRESFNEYGKAEDY